MNLDQRIIGKTLQHFRTQAGYTQRTLSMFLKANQSTISKWERGTINITLLELITFCEVVSIKLNKFINKMSKVKYTVKMEITI